MKILLLTAIMVFPLVSSLFAEDIPQQLQVMGLNRYTLIKVTYDDVYYYYTFADWLFDASGCHVTFIVRDGEVIDFYRECTMPRNQEQT